MKKYRLTKITVKTREIISMSKNPTDETQDSVCPMCNAPLNSYLQNESAEISNKNKSVKILSQKIIEEK